jgi:hypothetical protein
MDLRIWDAYPKLYILLHAAIALLFYLLFYFIEYKHNPYFRWAAIIGTIGIYSGWVYLDWRARKLIKPRSKIKR